MFDRVGLLVFYTTYNYISLISVYSVLLTEETGVVLQVTERFNHIKLYQVHLTLQNQVLVVINTDCIDICDTTTVRSMS